MVKAGDSIPDIELTEGNPGNKVNLSKELGSGLIIGVPAAFSKCPVNSRLVALSFVQP
jgi:peroxiredoxin 5